MDFEVIGILFFFFYGLAALDFAKEYTSTNIHYEKTAWVFGGQMLWGGGTLRTPILALAFSV